MDLTLQPKKAAHNHWKKKKKKKKSWTVIYKNINIYIYSKTKCFMWEKYFSKALGSCFVSTQDTKTGSKKIRSDGLNILALKVHCIRSFKKILCIKNRFSKKKKKIKIVHVMCNFSPLLLSYEGWVPEASPLNSGMWKEGTRGKRPSSGHTNLNCRGVWGRRVCVELSSFLF